MSNISNSLEEIRTLLPLSRILTDPVSLSVYSRDASLYRIIPQAVIKVENEYEMQRVMRIVHEHACPIGYRAAGTSLSGQALTNGILIMQGEGWRKIEVENKGELIRLEPGVRGSEANLTLKPYHKKIGPDPASIDAAKIGGIAANNASGMCCGTADNTYQTMNSLRIIFSDGSLLDTASEYSRMQFKSKHSQMLSKINSIAESIRCHPEWVAMINQKYLIKNTTGYSMNAFLDYSDPIDIIAHLMVGSEGTLGFISEITYKTVPDPTEKSNALVYFPDIKTACLAVTALSECHVNAIELMDNKALRSVIDQIDAKQLSSQTVTALLIEVQAETPHLLETSQKQILAVLNSFNVDFKFTIDLLAYQKYWKIRKGMFPSVAAMRGKNETVIIEDIAIPINSLAEGTLAIQNLFTEEGYSNSIIFGHAQAGNLHIVFTQAFENQEQIKRYQQLMDKLCDLIVDNYGGSLKAEHGTGRNMAPYVKKEWGHEIYTLMKKIKATLDPKNILNPDVVITNDSQVHLKNFKPMPTVNGLIDACMECGFCERICPSKNLSLTPRGRISAMRELTQQKKSLLSFFKDTMEKEIQYQALNTCATDGLCGEVCPVKINTGKYIKFARESQRSNFITSLATFISKRQNSLEAIARLGLSFYHKLTSIVGVSKLHSTFKVLHRLSRHNIPMLQGALPLSPNKHKLNELLFLNQNKNFEKSVVIYRSCINRVFGQSQKSSSENDITASLVSLATKAKFNVILADNKGSCCGLPYSSKGFSGVAKTKAEHSLDELQTLSKNGQWDIIIDNSPCSQELREASSSKSLRLFDSVEWISESIINTIDIKKQKEPLFLHITCSARKMGLENLTRKIAQRLSVKVLERPDESCCGFAGDLGFVQPELNQSTLSNLKEIFTDDCSTGISSSKTCSLGLEWNSGKEQLHIAQVLDENS